MKIFNNVRLWIIVALVIVVAGAAMIAIFGLNQTPDYKTSYEVKVSVDQNVSDAGETVKTAAEAYFAEIGYKYSSYATETDADGAEYIYKFHKAGNVDEATLNQKLKDALSASKAKDLNLVANAEYKQVATSEKTSVGGIILACCLGLLVAFIVSLFTVKAASAFTVLCNAVATVIIYIMLLAITRIPAYPDFIVAAAAGTFISVVMTFVITCSYKEKLKLSDKDTLSDVAAAGVKDNAVRLCVIAVAGVIVALGLSVTGSFYLAFTGLKIFLATVSAFLVSFVATPALWTVFKNVRSGK